MKFSILMSLFAFVLAFPAVSNAMEGAPKPVIKAVAFHSDSCGSCKILGPRMKDAMEIINKDKVDAVKFDFTNGESKAATKTLAEQKNLSPILEEYGPKTGWVALVNNDGKVIDKIKVDDTTADIAAKLATAIAQAS